MRRLRRVQLNVVLGQDFEDGPQPQPPLILRDAVPEGTGQGQAGDIPGAGSQALCPLPRVGKGGPRERHALEIRVLAQLSDGLEHQAALAHPQQARRVSRVGKDPPWEGHGNGWEPPGRELGMVGILLEQRLEMFGILQEGKTHGRVGGEWLGPSRKGKLGIFGISQEQGTPPRIRGRAFWECRVTRVHLGSPPPAAPTMPGALPDLPSDPGHGLGAHLGAEIPVKGGGAASLCRENLR